MSSDKNGISVITLRSTPPPILSQSVTKMHDFFDECSL